MNEFFTLKNRGSGFKNLNRYLTHLNESITVLKLSPYAQKGVEALRAATPSKTGLTADSWDYTITIEDGIITLTWFNKHIVDGQNIAILLDTGHASRDGSWVAGYHYIDPALEPVFEEILEEIRSEVNVRW